MSTYVLYMAIDDNKRAIEFDYSNILPDDRIWQRMHDGGADKVLSDRFEAPTLIVAWNIARLKWHSEKLLSDVERPSVALLRKPSGKWGATCLLCNRVVVKPMDEKRIQLIIVSAKQHVGMTHG